LEDVAFGLLNRGMEPEKAAEQARAALERVGMGGAASRAPYHLSAGEKKRVAIAGILATAPEILVLDEPTTFLDPPALRSLADLLVHLPQAKILVTHDARFAQLICRRAVFFQEGRIVADGPVAEVVSRFGWDFECEPSKSGR
jgi:cobalt/nickel transport system ATP-binding protein